MKRRAAIVAVLAVVAIGVVVGVLTRAHASAAQPRSLRGVVAQVRKSFGDSRLVRAKIHGSTVYVVTTGGSPAMKSEFEAGVLAAAVADWTRANGKTAITAMRYPGSTPTAPFIGVGVPLPTDAGLSSLHPGTCKSVAKASVRSLWETKVASVKQLPYLHGICVVRIRTANVVAAKAVVGPINVGMGDSEKRPWYVELDDSAGTPKWAMSWMPGLNGSTWASHDQLPFAHG